MKWRCDIENMNNNDLIIWLKENMESIITIIAFILPVLSVIFASVEYFRLKGKWDFFFVDKNFRSLLKNVIHPEHFVISFFTILFLAFLIIVLRLSDLSRTLFQGLHVVIITLIMFFIFLCVNFYFNINLIGQGIYTKKEFLNVVFVYSVIMTSECALQIIIFYISYTFIVDSKYLFVLPCIIISGILMIFFEYYKMKICISKNRVYDIINYNNKQYCVICIEKTGMLYTVEAKILNDEIFLYLGKRILLEPCNHEIETRVFKRIIRIFNGREMKNRI